MLLYATQPEKGAGRHVLPGSRLLWYVDVLCVQRDPFHGSPSRAA